LGPSEDDKQLHGSDHESTAGVRDSADIPEPRRTLVLTDAATALRVSEILGLMWMDLDFSDQVIEVKRASVWAQFKVPKSKASKAPVPMHPVLDGFLMAWRERTPYAKDDDYVFPSFRLKGKPQGSPKTGQ
jgi:integrase